MRLRMRKTGTIRSRKMVGQIKSDQIQHQLVSRQMFGGSKRRNSIIKPQWEKLAIILDKVKHGILKVH